MLRQASRTRSAAAAALARRHLSASAPGKPTSASKPPTSAAAPKKPVAESSAKPTSSAAAESSTGSSLPKILLLGLLSAPAATAVYVKQNPQWNPEPLRDQPQWLRFRELILGQEAAKPAAKPSVKVPATEKKAMVKAVEKETSRTPDELSAAISKGAEAAKKAEEKLQKLEKKVEQKLEKTFKKPKEEGKKEKKIEKKEKKAEKKDKAEDKSSKIEKKLEKAEKKAEKAEKKVAKLKQDAKSTAQKVEKEVKKDVKVATAAAAGAAGSFEKTVDAATTKAREEISKLADAANPEHLRETMDKEIQATTSELLNSLKAESKAAAADVDKQYLSGLNELDAQALSIRVAQLATEMKHRSKWEAVRLLEALRRMEQDAQKQSSEVLRRQSELHKELLARELRLQQELLARQTREEMAALKQQYSEDLAKNVSQQRASMLSELQRTFARETQAIQSRYETQMKEATDKMQETLAEEREQRLKELEAYRAELKALGAVLDSSSTYEAFSHRVHQTSMAALALSDRIEAAKPLRGELRALREAARNDPLIEAAVQSLPASIAEEGAPSVSQLQERFKVVKAVGHRASLVPEGSGIVGQAFGTALSLLMIPPGGPVEGTDADAVLSRAEFALKAGDIEQAVGEMKGLSGLPAEVSQDWIKAAESRLAVEQAAKVVKAHVALLAASCS